VPLSYSVAHSTNWTTKPTVQVTMPNITQNLPFHSQTCQQLSQIKTHDLSEREDSQSTHTTENAIITVTNCSHCTAGLVTVVHTQSEKKRKHNAPMTSCLHRGQVRCWISQRSTQRLWNSWTHGNTRIFYNKHIHKKLQVHKTTEIHSTKFAQTIYSRLQTMIL